MESVQILTPNRTKHLLKHLQAEVRLPNGVGMLSRTNQEIISRNPTWWWFKVISVCVAPPPSDPVVQSLPSPSYCSLNSSGHNYLVCNLFLLIVAIVFRVDAQSSRKNIILHQFIQSECLYCAWFCSISSFSSLLENRFYNQVVSFIVCPNKHTFTCPAHYVQRTFRSRRWQMNGLQRKHPSVFTT